MNVAIVGGGPSGLFTALLLAKQGYNVKIIEANNVIGGCHRVDRKDGLFSEHGPRIYVSNYNVYKNFLKLCDLDFDRYYEPYKYGFISTGVKSVLEDFTVSELGILSLHYVKFIVTPDSFKNKSIGELVDNFSDKSKALVDSLCKLTDGAGLNDYTAYSFFNLVNQNILYTIMEPKHANDKWLWNKVGQTLKGLGVEIVHEKVSSLKDNGSIVTAVVTNNNFHYADTIILATPPYHTHQILKHSSTLVKSSFIPDDKMSEYVASSSYFPYISFTIHFEKNTVFPDMWGGKKSNDWMIDWIVMSDYITDEPTDFITATIIDLDSKSSFTGLSANETSSKELLLEEATRQVLGSLKTNVTPVDVILCKGVFYDETWKTTDLPFMLTPKTKKIDSHGAINNLYWVGPHNLNNRYAFTSMENVCQNVLAFCKRFDTRVTLNVQTPWELNDIVLLITILLVTYIVYKYRKN